MGNDSSIVNDPRFNLEMVSHERRELTFDECAVAANNVLFVDIRVVLLAHDCYNRTGSLNIIILEKKQWRFQMMIL